MPHSYINSSAPLGIHVLFILLQLPNQCNNLSANSFTYFEFQLTFIRISFLFKNVQRIVTVTVCIEFDFPSLDSRWIKLLFKGLYVLIYQSVCQSLLFHEGNTLLLTNCKFCMVWQYEEVFKPVFMDLVHHICSYYKNHNLKKLVTFLSSGGWDIKACFLCWTITQSHSHGPGGPGFSFKYLKWWAESNKYQLMLLLDSLLNTCQQLCTEI
jgi:hypothetical protein